MVQLICPFWIVDGFSPGSYTATGYNGFAHFGLLTVTHLVHTVLQSTKCLLILDC